MKSNNYIAMAFGLSALLLSVLPLLYWVQALPGLNDVGGTNCDGTCGTSTACDVHCAPVNPADQGSTASVLRYCVSATFNTNGDCCCGCNTATIAGYDSYFWLGYDDKTCASVCPPQFYIPPAPNDGGYACRPCHTYCLECTGGDPSGYNKCKTCKSTSYQVNSTTCYADSALHSYSRYNPCPDDYYGIQINMQCVKCPTGCASCAIHLRREMPNGAVFGTSYANYDMTSKNCTGAGNDILCKYTLQCYSCYTGYTPISGHCVSNSQCQLYSKYNSSAGGSFSSANCYCFNAFTKLYPGYCQRCAFNCQTCSGTTSSDCTSCPTGAAGPTCAYDYTYSELLTSSPPTLGGVWTSNVGTPNANVDQGSCTGYIFGYYGYYNLGVYSFTSVSYSTYLNGATVTAGTTLTYGQSLFPNGATLTYSNSGAFTGTPHYSVNVRMTLLFIDDWTNGMSILFFEGGQSRYQFDYKMEGVVGEYLCGYASYDHHDVADFTFTHTSDSLNLKVYSAALGMHWAIKDVMIHAILCDSTCNSCSGPSSSECLGSCTESNKVAVDGVCVCDSANGYYLKGGACVTDCGTMIRNDLTYECVSACSFPNYFIETSSNGSYRSCVVNCNSTQYKKVSLTNSSYMTCVTDCFETNQTDITQNQFNFQGYEKVCYNQCPAGTFGDPVSHNCLEECPTYNSSTTHGYFSSGHYCYENCPTGWAYVPQRACLTSCPSGYYKNYLMKGGTNSSVCQQQCSVSLDGEFHYGDNATGFCTDLCSTGTYGDIASFLCLQVCNSSAYAQQVGAVRLCVVNCSLADGLYGNPESGFCVLPANCPTNYYGDPLTFQCTNLCSGTDYFGDNTTHVCNTTTCAGRAYRQNDSKVCVATCVNNNTLLTEEWGDNTTGYCVEDCPAAYYGDPQYNRECVQTCSSSPSSTFGLLGLCVVNCSNVTWADPYHANRICTDSCTPNRYGRNSTRTCVVGCPDGEFAHNVTYGNTTRPLCTPGCTQDSAYFGNIENNRCENKCPSPYYGDVTGLRLCTLKCPWPYYASNCTTNASGTTVISSDRVCRLDCTSCGFADNSSQLCAWTSAGCMNLTYANNASSSCVIPMECQGFADPVSRYCISVCQNLADAQVYFGDPSTKNCVLTCPEDPDTYGQLHGNATTNQTCVSVCSSTYVRDPQHSNRWCVAPDLCSRSPLVLFGDTVKDLCVTALNCTDGYYGDNVTKKCVQVCGGPLLLLADNVTKECVQQCGLGWFGLYITAGQGVCSQFCPSGQWADNLTVKCTTRCSNLTYGTNYTMNWTSSSYNFTVYGVCETECREGEFARDEDNLCVTNCGNNNASALWGDPLSKTCKTSPFSCPDGYYADNTTHMCVVPLNCSVVGGVQYVADNLTRTCVAKCPSTVHNFADMDKQLCVARCPDGFFGYNSTLKCVQQCKDPTNSSFDGSYADPQLSICVKVCSAYPSELFGQNITFTCVEARYCPNLTWAEVAVYSRQCRPYCPAPNTYSKNNSQMYADNITKTCVEECPTYSYADLSLGYGMCLYVCPKYSNNTMQYADNSTKKCVAVCPAAQSTFGDNLTVSCVVTCPVGSYAQVTPFRYCVAKCAEGTWGEDIKRTCVTSPKLCPTVNGSLYYAENISTMCVKKCPGPTNSTAGSWGQNTTQACLPSCLLNNGSQSGFKWNLTRVCIDICPAEISVDGSYSDQGMCYYVCMTANYSRDPQNKRSCQSSCSFSPLKQYLDDTTWRCLAKCPTYPVQYYADDNAKKCVATCTLSYRKLEATKVCVQTCPNATFFNPDTYQCLQKCPTQTSIGYNLYGDTSAAEAKCVNDTDCPNNTYADDKLGLCVSACTQGQWIYGKNCMTQCPDGFYGNPDSLVCVQPLDCPADYFADNETVTCVQTCSGSFGYIPEQRCVFVCPNVTGQLYYADPFTRKCSTGCTYNATVQLIKNDFNQTCVSECSPELFFDPFTFNCTPTCSHNYYSDNSTRTCVSICPATPPLYGQNKTYTCVQECLNVSQFRFVASRVCVFPCPDNYYMENVSRLCVSTCPNMTYADATSGYCVSNCSTNFSLDDSNTCVTTCPEPYFNDPTTYKCVYDCPFAPQAYFQVVNTTRYCDTACPSGQFRDFTSFICTEHCELSPVTFADTTSGSCLAVCSTGFYGYLNDRTCLDTCPGGMFADPNTRMCVEKCDEDLGFYGDPYVSPAACVAICSSGYFADPYSQTCVDICQTFPKMYGYDSQNASNLVRECVYSCPYPWVANDYTGECHLKCSSSAYPYLDKAVKACVAACTSPIYQYSYMPTGQTVEGECVKFCPTESGTPFFALLTNNSCVKKCPDGLYGCTVNNTCMPNCLLGDGLYADPAINLCVSVCTHNTSYFSYADEFTRTCVTECPADKGQVGDRLIWKCVSRCSSISQFAYLTDGYCLSQCPPNYFADNTTQTCVSNCSLYTLMYGDTVNRVCVEHCPNSTLFTDNTQRLCVLSTACSPGLFGYTTTGQCIAVCPSVPDLYGHPDTRTCEYQCPNVTSSYFADPVSRLCVLQCPSVPAYYANNNTLRCVLDCPDHSYADNHTRLCIKVCSIAEFQTFADNTTNQCVRECPTEPNYYASNYTWECVYNCPSTPAMYADNSTRSCVYYCPGGVWDLYADDSTRRCVHKCPNLTYNENSTRKCKDKCVTGYADPASKYCIARCPHYTYGENTSKACLTGCPLVSSVQLYAEDGNSICMKDCLAVFKTYADPYSKRCVRICPISQDYYAEPTSRTCMHQCPESPIMFADFSTRFCVYKCPTAPALFGIIPSRVCAANCPNDTWADNNSRTCLSLCVTTPQTFGDNSTWSCVTTCPTEPDYYANNMTHLCVPTCPGTPDYYADNITRKCVYNCPNYTYADSTTRRCVTTCPQGYFGVNSTWRCELKCPWREFADELLNLCVAKCSLDPIYYGNPDNLKCVPECPEVNNSYGNPLSQECVNYQSNGTSGCPIAYFSDNTTRLCVQVCPMSNDTYGDNSTWKCVAVCPAGSENTFADNSTMRCVEQCPSYPEYYAEEYSRRCVHFCLAPNSTYSGSFSDNSTRLCVERCPALPDYFSDNSTGRCVFYCPQEPITFADNQTRRCVTVCPSVPDIYGDNSTLRCVPDCPKEQDTFADNNTRLCVKVCPNDTFPPLYADNISQRCLPECPVNSYADNLTQKCVAVCPRQPDTYGDPYSHKCVWKCPSTPDIFADPISHNCIPLCDLGYYAENTTRRCLQECLWNETNYADDSTRRCVAKCPMSELTWGDNQTQKCVKQCSDTPTTYADNVTQTCVLICPNVTAGGFADNRTRICVTKCPDGSYGDITTRYCVRYCPAGWFGYTDDNLCVEHCPTPWFADNTTWMCVLECPRRHTIFGQTINNTCVSMCPEGTYASDEKQECVTKCPNASETALGHDTFGYNATNDCVEECPVPLFGYPVDQVCVEFCPNPYYHNFTDHRCYKCPDPCAVCIHPFNCISCNSGYYLYSGACVESCPTFPVILYANPNRICGTAFNCTQGYYALNATKSCVSVCPAGYYVNVQAQTCDSCMKGCINCKTVSSCLACNPTTAIWSNYTCYTFCSALKRFYTLKGCVSSCPTGTYLELTTCQNCSVVCKTCTVTAENCLICANGYYRSNGICVSQCPSGTIAQVVNGSQTCVSCSVVGCQEKPLTYEVTQFVDNFKYNVQIQFNQPVNILAEIDKVIRIQQLTNARLLAVTTYTYLDYTIYDYGNGLYSFVLNNYNPTSGTQVEVQILDPSAIQTDSGQMPQTTRSQITVDTDSLYSEDSYNSGISGYLQAVAVSAFVLLLFAFGTHHSTWMPMYDFMQSIMIIVFINVTLPPNLLYSVKSSMKSAFTFLPSFFSSAFDSPPYNKEYNNNNIYSLMKDAAFLRVIGSIFFVLLMLVVFMVIVGILSKKAPRKQVKKWAKEFLRESFWKKHMHGLIYVWFLPVFALGVYNMTIYGYLANSFIQIFSILSTYLFMVTFIVVVVYFAYKMRSIAKDYPIAYLMIQKAYNFILYQKTVLIENNNHHFTYQKNQFDLTDARQPKVNQLAVFPYPIQTRADPWSIAFPLISYLHKLLTAVFLTMAFNNPVIQLILLILINLAYLVYIIVKRPLFKVTTKEYNNQMYIHNLVAVSIIYIALLIFVFLYSSLSLDNRVLIGNCICGVIIEGFTVNIIYFYFRTYNYYHHHVWKAFVRSDFFRINYIVEHLEWTKAYDQEQHKLIKEVKPRPEFLEAIKVETGEALADMVRREPSLSSSTKDKMKALQLRPNRAQMVSKEYGEIFSSIVNEKQKSHKSVASSERLSKQERKKIRDTIFGEKEADQKNLEAAYSKLELIDEKEEVSHEASVDEDNEETEYEYQFFQEEYPEGTPMESIMEGCKKGDVVLH